MEEYGVPLYEEKMVEHPLDHIASPNTELNKEFNICRSPPSSTFFKSSSHLSTMVAILYSSANPSLGRFRKRSIYAACRGDRGEGRGGSFNVRSRGRRRGGRVGQFRGGHVRGGRGGVSGANDNGIDISDVTRYFEDLEGAALSNDTGKRIIEETVRTKFLANKKRRTTRSVSAENYNESWLISQIITGLQNSIRNESVLAGGVTRLPTNGSRE